MKKLLSIMLAMAMILSVVIIAAIPTAAIDGDWTVVAQGKQESGELDADKQSSVAGYEYDEEGFHLTAANWSGHTPWARFVSKEKVDLKDGVYMEIRVDEFNFDASLDSWFNVIFWDQQIMTPGESEWGEGMQILIRGSNYLSDTSVYHGTSWWKGPFNGLGVFEELPAVVVDGKHTFTVVLSWDAANNTFVYSINGHNAPAGVITYMNEKWGGDDSEAYVGFCLQHSAKDGKVAATLLKYGTSAETATVPAGDDHKDPIDNSTNFVAAPVVENPTFEAGKPGILMTGDVANSNVKDVPGSSTGEQVSVNEDGTLKVVAQNAASGTGSWIVENATSYAIEDLPIVMMVTRNLCTCTEEDKEDGLCCAYEESTVYLMTGDTLNANGSCMTSADVSWDPYIIGDDTYLSLMLDASDMEMFSGRINSVRFDIKNVNVTTPGANIFDVCFVAFFATEEDANAYLEAYLTNLGWEDPDAGEETTEEETTVAGGDNTDETTVAGGDNTDETTVAGGDNTNDETTAPQGGSTEAPAKKGCKGVVGFGAVAIVAVASVAGFVSFKKKED